MEEYIIGIAKQALFLSLIITAPPVIVALVVGLAISIVQATTQIQEMTLTFVPKLVAVVVTLALAGSWMMVQLVSFTNIALSSFSNYVK